MIAIKMRIMVVFVFFGAVKLLFLDRWGSLYNNSVSYTFMFIFLSITIQNNRFF